MKTAHAAEREGTTFFRRTFPSPQTMELSTTSPKS
eukprot:CCRYP_001159-RB/>CCRYP_001159-RB protein AED:0.49 eAED:0.49 QI:0/-1/0/1/-1/0/1/0/34